MNNRIELKLDRSVTRLAGFEYGKNVYEEQVKGKINTSLPVTFIFPDNIKKLASSFIQGFFAELVESIGISGIERNVGIESSNELLKKDILDNLL